jgi:acylphosphatase
VVPVTRVRVIVRGRVQGVGFRFYARAIANSLALRGTVRNLPDGRAVEAVVQGDPARLEEFTAAMERGPSGAVVESLDRRPEHVDPGLPSFSIIV